jgi:XTP/dITP diphosphohydrolase
MIEAPETLRQFAGPRLVIATHNAGKLREFRQLMGDRVRALVSAGELGLPEPAETGTTFLANAMLKARAAAQASGEIVLADDSGLSVTALGGAPGVYSADWAGPDKNFPAAMQRIQDEMGAAADRSASFICALVLAWPDGSCEVALGRVDGTLIWPPRGFGGFGYDPMFVPKGYTKTFAELDGAEKQRISHRGRAIRLLLDRCFSV